MLAVKIFLKDDVVLKETTEELPNYFLKNEDFDTVIADDFLLKELLTSVNQDSAVIGILGERGSDDIFKEKKLKYKLPALEEGGLSFYAKL